VRELRERREAISDAGYIVGKSMTTGGSFHGFLISPEGGMTDLPPLAGFTTAAALGVNNYGHAVGYSEGPGKHRRATAWIAGDVIDLGSSWPYVHNEARGINDAGQMVGEVMDGFTETGGMAVIWQYGGWGWLPNTGSSAAHAINASGVVAGRSYNVSSNNEVAALWDAAPAIPDAPSNVTTSAWSHNQVSVDFTDESWNEASFKVQRRARTGDVWTTWATVGDTEANAYNYVDGGLTANTEYEYRVRACNTTGCSANITGPRVTTLAAPTTAPYAPYGAAATAMSTTEMFVTWNDASPDEDNFELQRRTKIGGVFGAWTPVATPVQNQTGYVDAGLSPATVYQYRVRACNSAGCSINAVADPVSTRSAPPAAPTGLTASVVSSSQINLTWGDASTTELGFTLQRRVNVGGTWQAWATVAPIGANVTAHSDTGLTSRTTYQYRIKACDANYCSRWAVSAKAKTL
jgi:probable HAF family extracellular repeat protein